MNVKRKTPKFSSPAAGEDYSVIHRMWAGFVAQVSFSQLCSLLFNNAEVGHFG
jgi:hypothetical protein